MSMESASHEVVTSVIVCYSTTREFCNRDWGKALQFSLLCSSLDLSLPPLSIALALLWVLDVASILGLASGLTGKQPKNL